MNTVEIRRKVNQINTELGKAFALFVLNDETIKELQSKLDIVQSECPHEFVNGYCIHCDKAEEEQ